MMDDASKPQANFIAGEWVTSTTVLDNIDPATGTVFAQVCLASSADVDRSVAAARKVHEARTLIDVAPPERGRMLLRIAAELNALRTQGAKLLTRESGKRGAVRLMIANIRLMGQSKSMRTVVDATQQGQRHGLA